jgi:hypothetical protein
MNSRQQVNWSTGVIVAIGIGVLDAAATLALLLGHK